MNQNTETIGCGSKAEHHHSCGWCPSILPCDHDEWRHHFLLVHGDKGGGYSIRDHAGPADWDAALAGLGIGSQEARP